MQKYLKTFWTKLESIYLSLTQHEEQENLHKLRFFQEQHRQEYQELLTQELLQIQRIYEEVDSKYLNLKEQYKYRRVFRARTLEQSLTPQEIEQLQQRILRQIEQIVIIEDLEAWFNPLQLQKLARIIRLHSLSTPKSSVEIKQKSHIKGWLSKFLLEEWRGELEALRYSWLKESKPELWIKIMTGFYLLGLFKAYLQIKVENRWLFKRKQS